MGLGLGIGLGLGLGLGGVCAGTWDKSVPKRPARIRCRPVLQIGAPKFPLFTCGNIFQRGTCGTIRVFITLPLYPMCRTMLTCFDGIIALHIPHDSSLVQRYFHANFQTDTVSLNPTPPEATFEFQAFLLLQLSWVERRQILLVHGAVMHGGLRVLGG